MDMDLPYRSCHQLLLGTLRSLPALHLWFFSSYGASVVLDLLAGLYGPTVVWLASRLVGAFRFSLEMEHPLYGSFAPGRRLCLFSCHGGAGCNGIHNFLPSALRCTRDVLCGDIPLSGKAIPSQAPMGSGNPCGNHTDSAQLEQLL